MPETPDFRSQDSFRVRSLHQWNASLQNSEREAKPGLRQRFHRGHCFPERSQFPGEGTQPGSLNSDDIAGPLNNRVRSGFLREWEGQADW